MFRKLCIVVEEGNTSLPYKHVAEINKIYYLLNKREIVLAVFFNDNWTVIIYFLFLFLFSCYERFFKHVNLKENKLVVKRRGGHMMNDLELIGLEYLWRVCI